MVGGVRARQMWGDQFVKVIEGVYRGIQGTSDTSESGEADAVQVGASGPEGKAGRVKVLLEIEKVMSS